MERSKVRIVHRAKNSWTLRLMTQQVFVPNHSKQPLDMSQRKAALKWDRVKGQLSKKASGDGNEGSLGKAQRERKRE